MICSMIAQMLAVHDPVYDSVTESVIPWWSVAKVRAPVCQYGPFYGVGYGYGVESGNGSGTGYPHYGSYLDGGGFGCGSNMFSFGGDGYNDGNHDSQLEKHFYY